MKTILITGAGGFIGSHLCEELARRGNRVRAMVHYRSERSEGWLAELPDVLRERIEIIPGDVRDAGLVHRLMKGVDVVYHLAALIGIPWSYEAPASYVQTNVQGTLNVLEAARAHGVRRVVHTSTSEVYGTARRVPIDEDHPLQPQSPYAASKVAADAMARSFHASFGLPTVIDILRELGDGVQVTIQPAGSAEWIRSESPGRELRWILLVGLAALLSIEQILGYRLSYHATDDTAPKSKIFRRRQTATTGARRPTKAGVG